MEAHRGERRWFGDEARRRSDDGEEARSNVSADGGFDDNCVPGNLLNDQASESVSV
jgi:hypothetical protein